MPKNADRSICVFFWSHNDLESNAEVRVEDDHHVQQVQDLHHVHHLQVRRGCVGSHGRGEEHGDGGGDVDVVLVVKSLRKAKRPVAVVSVGEPDKEKKKEEADKPEESKPLPACCRTCNSVVVWYDEPNVCSIL
ncbi:Heavy-metal-associated domain [Musa troglodytarum]|uniref:Heavy-metal-associated domain n=1 Tax=Musa troglodytarum TaxID=320322 RepID=A0A9E7JEN9_9LILI|nr:Heavy-metal-associated domain [Musa troglodytarum]